MLKGDKMIENIIPGDFSSRGFFSPAKKIDMGNNYLIYVSGIQPYKEKTTNKCTTDDIATQTHQVFEQIGKILKEAGATFDDIVKAVIYVTDMKDFDVISPIRAKYFEKSKPVSTLVEVNGFTHLGGKIEIEVTAVLNK